MTLPAGPLSAASAASSALLIPSADELRHALQPLPRQGEIREPGVDPAGLRPAAVLFPIVRHDAGPSVLLTQRTPHLSAHAGQISFPGGQVEPEDPTLLDTALRETEEEIGLPRSAVEVLGYLPEYFTVTGFRITPVVGLLTPPFDLVPDAREVDEVFEVPLAFLLDPANRQRHAREWQGRQRYYYALPYGERYIWGATAGMIVALADALAALRGEGR
ncbi:CoA pyrophosphatase [Oryzomicrobium sp.]|uniref:CoA pyrophosphatase n=1 Tax=Oryzomicrobium sp. TaxID=1911578 RepID=UPI002FE296D0